MGDTKLRFTVFESRVECEDVGSTGHVLHTVVNLTVLLGEVKATSRNSIIQESKYFIVHLTHHIKNGNNFSITHWYDSNRIGEPNVYG